MRGWWSALGRDHQKPRLPEGGLDLVSEGSQSEAASDRSGSSGSSKLQHSSLASVPGGDDTDVRRVLTATMARAANSSFSQVLFRFMM